MAFIYAYNSVLQVLAAFVIFLFGYLAFFLLLTACLFIATGLYEGAKWIRMHAVRSASATSATLYFGRLFNRLGGIESFSSQQPGGPHQ
jgi:hypothetical protein